jgi:hypothetical protein
LLVVQFYLEIPAMRHFVVLATSAVMALNCTVVEAAVVINEIAYDDGATDDLEFIELYNSGPGGVDISGWFIAGQDEAGPNFQPVATYTIPALTMLAAGDYYVIANPSVPNVDLTIDPGTAGVLENDAELTELRDNSNNLVDAFLQEANKGPDASTTTGYGTLSAEALAEVGGGDSPGYFGNFIGADTTALVPAGSLARFVDGVDTNNNGRDFGFRPSTPGATNNPMNVTAFTAPDVSVASGVFVGDPIPGWAYGFDAPARVIQPSVDIVADPSNRNPNVIPAPPTGDDRAIIAYDPAGGGNGYAAPETFNTDTASFDLWVYFDTNDFPRQTNAAGTEFRGSEYSFFNLGGADSVANASNLNGPGFANTVNGTTGLAWVYEKTVAENPDDPNPETNGVIEKLYLVDAGDGGPNDINMESFEWTILHEVDLSTTPSGWYRLSIAVAPGGDLEGDYNSDGTVDAADYVVWRKSDGTQEEYDEWRENFGESGGGPNGTAIFDDQVFNFSTDFTSGAFGTGYRENLQLGAVTVPYTIMRPPTFVQYVPPIDGSAVGVPEPSAAVLVLYGAALLFWQRSKTRRNLQC